MDDSIIGHQAHPRHLPATPLRPCAPAPLRPCAPAPQPPGPPTTPPPPPPPPRRLCAPRHRAPRPRARAPAPLRLCAPRHRAPRPRARAPAPLRLCAPRHRAPRPGCTVVLILLIFPQVKAFLYDLHVFTAHANATEGAVVHELEIRRVVRAPRRITSKHRGRRGARPARSEEGEYIDVFNRRATLRAGMDRRPNAEVILRRALNR
jgi:hypothetical protein